MGPKTFFTSFLVFAVACVFCCSCTQTGQKSGQPEKIENTLKSVSLWLDSIPIAPSELLSSIERINTAIDSIGYPDAGYKLWLVQGDSVKDFRFMLEGYWPNQAIYDSIHNHELYKNATNAEENLWKGLKNNWYNRFTRVK